MITNQRFRDNYRPHNDPTTQLMLVSLVTGDTNITQKNIFLTLLDEPNMSLIEVNALKQQTK